MRNRRLWFVSLLVVAVSFTVTLSARAASPAPALTLLNVSYDPTRELYEAVNNRFAAEWQKEHGQKLTLRQSHGGSGKQARSVIDGLEADVVTLALGYDVDAIQKAGLIKAGWQDRLPDHSTPFTSTVVFLVRKGNPKHIKDWDDLIRADVSVITPNPKTSGGARWNYLAAWGAVKSRGGDDAQAKAFVTRLLHNVPVLDSGARGATTSFVERGLGDVLIAWENEALLAVKKSRAGELELVAPSVSILAEPPVAVVDQVVDRRGTRAAAEAYLKALWGDAEQEIGAQQFYRPRSPAIAKKYAAQFATVKLFGVDTFGGWTKAQATHFAEGGTFDQIYQPGAKR